MTIKEVSLKYDISEYTLRYYEKEGLIGPVKKNKSGIRDYTEEDLKRIEFVICMRSADLPISVLKEYMSLFDQGSKTKEQRKQLLKHQRDILSGKLSDMQDAFDKLNIKIKMYDEEILETKEGNDKNEI